MARLTAAVGDARGMVNFAVRKGVDSGHLLAAAGMTEGMLGNFDARLSLSAYRRLIEACARLTNDPAFALHYAEAIDVSEISVLRLITHASETMIDAFAQINRYTRLITDVASNGPNRFTLERDGEGLWLTDHRTDPNDFIELTEMSFARMVCGTRMFGATPFVVEVHVSHSAPPYAREYEAVFQAPVKFSADHNAMRVDERWLTYRVAKQPRFTFGILSAHADRLLKDLHGSDGFAHRIEAVIMPRLHTGAIDLAMVANELGISRQTIFRRLKAENTSYEKLLDNLRHRLALSYFQERKVSINEVAYLLGYSAPSAFTRAFKRWTGTSPRATLKGVTTHDDGADG